jgi:hypothetical protein
MAEVAPISLYLDLEEGQHPDLEAVAKAAIAWNALLKEVIHVLDPSIEIRVEYVSGTEGSATVDSLVRAIKKVSKEHPFVVGPLVAIATAFFLAPANMAGEEATKFVMEQLGHPVGDISDADAEKIARKVVEMQRNRVAVEHKQEVYRQAEREPVIRGVGVTSDPHQRPQYLVKRSDFPDRAGVGFIEEETVEARTEYKYDLPVVVIRAIMLGEPRRWRFQHGAEEFSATMQDKDFLAAIKSGHTGVEVGEGVEMRVDLKIPMEKVGGVWREKERFVTRVVWPVPGRQIRLEFAANEGNEAGDQGDERDNARRDS